MADKPRPRSRETGASGPDRRDLLNAYENLVKSERDRIAAELAAKMAPPPNKGRLSLGLLIMLVCASIVVTRPAWLFPSSLPPETPVVQDASLKLQIYRVAMRIDAYRRTNGRLPESAAEAGAEVPGTAYRVPEGTDHYEITAGTGSSVVTYDSRTPMAGFLGDSYAVIQQRSRQ